jgi:hypothetical protein
MNAPDELAPAPNGVLLLNALGLQRRYGVILHLGTAEKPLKIHYEVTVSCTEAVAPGVFRLRLQKETVFINGSAPDSLLDSLSADLGKIIYPLCVEVDEKGQFLHLSNGAEIQERWKEARPNLARYYTGTIAERGLIGMDRALANAGFLAQQLRHDWLLTLLCAPVYRPYQNHQATAEAVLPMVAYKPPVKYALTLRTAPERTESGFVKVTATGSCADARSGDDILRGRPLPLDEQSAAVGEVALEYKLYPHNGTLFSVTGEVTLQLPAGEKRVEVEVYQLNPRDYIPDKAREATSVIVEVESVPKKKSWSDFWK